jgi:primosomal replication protein N
MVTSYEAQLQRDNKQQMKIRGSGQKNEARKAKYLY